MIDTIRQGEAQEKCEQHIFVMLPGNRSSPKDNAIILVSNFRHFAAVFLVLVCFNFSFRDQS